jgi:hypothetical protein
MMIPDESDILDESLSDESDPGAFFIPADEKGMDCSLQ